MANESEKGPEDALDDIHAWIANIACSKPGRNLTRDFSNAVLMAEVLKVYYPRYVDLHNYAPANNVQAKISNWNLLNRKVLAKIDMRLSTDKIQQLASAHPGAIEQLLLELKTKLARSRGRHDEKSPTGIEDSRQNETELSEESANHSMESVSRIEHNRIPIVARVRAGIYSIVKYLLRWLLIFNIFSYFFKRVRAPERSQTSITVSDTAIANGALQDSPLKEEETNVSYQVFSQLKQELREKNDVISSLNQKIICLENTMEQVDLRILDLTTKVLENSFDSEKLKTSKSKTKLNSSED